MSSRIPTSIEPFGERSLYSEDGTESWARILAFLVRKDCGSVDMVVIISDFQGLKFLDSKVSICISYIFGWKLE